MLRSLETVSLLVRTMEPRERQAETRLKTAVQKAKGLYDHCLRRSSLWGQIRVLPSRSFSVHSLTRGLVRQLRILDSGSLCGLPGFTPRSRR